MTHDSIHDPLAKRILDRIEEDKVRPRPRWEFIAKNYLFWGFGAAAVIFGSLAFSAALFEVQSADWNYAAATHADFLTFALAVAPYLWVGALALFVLIGYVNIRFTKRGYRYPLAVIALGAVITSVALGSGLYAAGLGGEVEEVLGDHPPFYRPILVAQRSWWSAPDKGLLAGEVLSVATDSGSFVLKDFSGNEWSVDASEITATDTAPLAEGAIVRIVGVASAATSSALHACFVFPWEDKGKGKPEKARKIPPGEAAKPTATFGERSAALERSEVCKGIRPYAQLRRLESGL